MCIILNEIFTIDKVPVALYLFLCVCPKRILPNTVNLQAVHCLSYSSKILLLQTNLLKGKTEGFL